MSDSLGHPRLHLRVVDSTNARARELALAGAPHGTLVTASEQTAGRGRQGRSWSAPPGSALLVSLVLRSPPPLLPLIAAVAVCDAVGEEALVKWPNDVVLVRLGESPRGQPPDERTGVGTSASTAADADADADAGPPGLAKLAGILTEGRPQEGWAVLGIGLNVAVRLEDLPAQLRGRAATLGEQPSAIEPTLALLLDALRRRLEEPSEAVLETYRERDALRGRAIVWTGGEGRALGVDDAGRLVVTLADGGRVALDAGEVHLRV
jgi:BirA family transcriptional regulator, biotin operon repressor / biotin---[acetyl-CoA-carboxylase] ligase